jgi:hypothetical protein
MSRVSLSLVAYVDPAETPVVIAGANMLSECLGVAAGGGPWPVALQFGAPGAPVRLATAPSAVILSLLPEASAADAFTAVEARWRERVRQASEIGAPVFVCTVFRHVAERTTAEGASRLERIRRLNLLAVQLSHELGVFVVDLDRALAHLGARTLQTDYRLGGSRAATVGAHQIAWSVLSFGLDPSAVPPELQERARSILDQLDRIDGLIERREALLAGQIRG